MPITGTPEEKRAALATLLTLPDKPLEWIRPRVGCYWESAGPGPVGEFSIASYRDSGPMPQPFPRAGLELMRYRMVIGRYPSLALAKAGAEGARSEATIRHGRKMKEQMSEKKLIVIEVRDGEYSKLIRMAGRENPVEASFGPGWCRVEGWAAEQVIAWRAALRSPAGAEGER